MLPFQSNLSQYIADLYASTSYYQSIYVYPNQENFWAPVSYPEYSPSVPTLNYYEPENIQKAEDSTRPVTKTKKQREKVSQESSASCQSSGEESEESPDFKSRQKYGRNISSNIFHQMLKAIRA